MADIIIYNTPDGKAVIKLYAENGTVWLPQAQIAELFSKNVSTISRHIANIFDENELVDKSNLRFMQINQKILTFRKYYERKNKTIYGN